MYSLLCSDLFVENSSITNCGIQFVWQDQAKHIHIWHGSHHHYFKQKTGLELSDDDEVRHKPSFDTSSHPQGTVVAPMAGLVVKLLVKDGTKVDEGQPILVLEAMKMEVCTNATFILHHIVSFLRKFPILNFWFFALPLKAHCKGSMCRVCPWASGYCRPASY